MGFLNDQRAAALSEHGLLTVLIAVILGVACISVLGEYVVVPAWQAIFGG